MFADTNTGSANLRALWDSSTSSDRHDGLLYWEKMRARMQALGEAYGQPLEVVAGVFCALSPNNSERVNVRDTEAMLFAGPARAIEAVVHTYPAHKQKAVRILSEGAWPGAVLGRKTRSMWWNILQPYAKEYVTIDGHMWCIWQNVRVPLSQARLTDKQYNVIEGAVRRLGNTLGTPPCAVQAVLWLTWKRKWRVLYEEQRGFEWALVGGDRDDG